MRWLAKQKRPSVQLMSIAGWRLFRTIFLSFLNFFILFYNCSAPLGFLPCEIWVAFLVESQLRQSRATQPTVHAGFVSVSIIQRTDMDYRIFNVRT